MEIYEIAYNRNLYPGRLEYREQLFATKKAAEKRLDALMQDKNVIDISIRVYTRDSNDELTCGSDIVRFSIFDPFLEVAVWFKENHIALPAKVEIRRTKELKKSTDVQLFVEGHDVTKLLAEYMLFSKMATPYELRMNNTVYGEVTKHDGAWIANQLHRYATYSGFRGLFDKGTYIDLGKGKPIKTEKDYALAEKKEVNYAGDL